MSVHVDVDDRCGEKRQQLRTKQTTDKRRAERLANLRPCPRAQHERAA
jgi:hypothetical protein